MKKPKHGAVITWEDKPSGCPFIFQFEPNYARNQSRLILKNMLARIYPERSRNAQNFAGYIGYEAAPFELHCSDGYKIMGTVELKNVEGKKTIGIYIQFTYGYQDKQYYYNGFIQEFSNCHVPSNGEIIELEEPDLPIEPDPPILPYDDEVIENEEVIMENIEYTDIFHFTGIKQPSDIPCKGKKHFVFCKTDSSFYKMLLEDAIQEEARKLLVCAGYQFQNGTIFNITQDFLNQIFDVLIEIYEKWKNEYEVSFDELTARLPLSKLSGNWANEPEIEETDYENCLPDVVENFLKKILSDLIDCYNAMMLTYGLSEEDIVALECEPGENNAASVKGIATIEQFTVAIRLTNLLIVLTQQPTANPHKYLSAVLVLTKDIFAPVFPPNPESDACVRPIGIGELMLVREQPCKYVLGEVAHIENVMPHEYKEKSKRHKDWTTDRTRESSEKDFSDGKQTANNLNYQIEEKLESLNADDFTSTLTKADKTKTYTDDKESIAGGGWTLTVNPNEDFAVQALEFAKGITGKVVSKLFQSNRKRREQIIFHELENLDRSVFSNKRNEFPIIGIYRWVNLLSLAKLINKGKRLVLEFSISNPADGINPEGEYVAPPEILFQVFKNLDFNFLTPGNYYEMAAVLNVEHPILPPEEEITITTTLQSEPLSNNTILQIPEGYQATSASISYLLDGENASLKGIIGVQTFPPAVKPEIEEIIAEEGSTNAPESVSEIPSPPPLLPSDIQSSPEIILIESLNGETTTLPVAIISTAEDYFVNVEVKCTIQPKIMEEWRLKAYQSLKKAYHKYLKSENWKQYKHRVLEKQKKIEVEQLKKKCIDCLINDLEPNASIETQIALKAWLEDAFLWNEMVYEFISEIEKLETTENETPDWHQFEEDNTESDFIAFLRADQAIIQVMVNKENELNALFTIWTNGQLWDGLRTDAPILSNYLFYAYELLYHQDQDEKIEKKWTIKTPTDMLKLQIGDQLPSLGSCC